MTALEPLGARVLIEPMQPQTTTESGIVLVEQAVPETMGRVVAVGSGYHPAIEPLRAALSAAAETCSSPELAREWVELVEGSAEPEPVVAVGDIVLFSWQAGQELLIDGERRLMLHQDDILAVVEDV